jgi:hypothetical protein
VSSIPFKSRLSIWLLLGQFPRNKPEISEIKK